MINRNNIAAFIAELFQNKYQQAPPSALLAKWENLDDDEIQENLQELFGSWGQSADDLQAAIQRFEQHTAAHGYASTQAPPPPEPLPYSLPEQQQEQHVPLNAERERLKAQYYPPAIQRRRRSIWPFIIVLALIAVAGYFGYQYYRYSSQGHVYCITANVALRDAAGEMVGRMDLEGTKVPNNAPSYSKLRAMDNEVHDLIIDNRSYPCRKVMEDNASFADYLFHRQSIARYVNANFVVNDKDEYHLYTNIFKQTNNVAQDNRMLKATVRKVIVGSMALKSSLANEYILTHSSQLSSSALAATSSIIVQELRPNQHYIIIAGLSNGKYYRFEGDMNTNQYVPPILVQTMAEDGTNQQDLAGNFRFITKGGVTRLYDVNNPNISSNYVLIKDTIGKILAFQHQPPAPIPAEAEEPDGPIRIPQEY